MPTSRKNEVILFTEEELPTAEAEILSAIEKAIKQPTPNLLDISMALLSVEMNWRTNLRQTREVESFDANQSLKTLQEREQGAKNRFPDQAIAAGSADQLVTLQQQLRNEVASIAAQRADLETKRDHAQSDLEILFADLEKGDKLKSQFQKPAIVNANIPLSRPTVNALSRLFIVSPVKEETTLVLSPGQDLLTTARDTIAASKTRALTSITDDAITIEVKKRSVGRPKLSNTPTVVHFKVSDILKDEGINLSELDSTNAQGITMSLKALLRDDVGIEDPTLDDMEKSLRGIVRGDYRELLDNRRTLLTLDGLAKPKTAPVKVGEVELAEKVVFTATPTVQPRRAFTTPEPKPQKPLLVVGDNDPLVVALQTKKGGHLKTKNAGDLAYGVTKVWLNSGDKRAEAGKKKEMLRLTSTIQSIIDTSRTQKIANLDELVNSPAINLPTDIKDSLKTSMRSIRETPGNEKFQLPVEALEYLPELIILRTNSPFKPKTMPDLLLLLAKKQAETKSSK